MKLEATSRTRGDRCPFCHDVLDDEARVTLRCVDCAAGFHLGCVAEASPRRCSTCGGQVLDERAGRGIVRRAWRFASHAPTWRRRLARVAVALLLCALSFGIVFVDARYGVGLTSLYFLLLIVVLSACVLFNLRDGRWELNLREREPRSRRRDPKALKR